jgi:hypothetical protein
VATASVAAVDDLDSDDFFLTTATPLEPATLALGTLEPDDPRFRDRPEVFWRLAREVSAARGADTDHPTLSISSIDT